MIKRLRVLIASLTMVTMIAVPAGTAFAGAFDFFKPCNGSGTSSSSVCQDKSNPQSGVDNSIYGPNGIITKIANIIAIIVGIVAVIVIIVAGIQYMLSTGDPTKVNNAKNAIIYAVVGLVIVFLARTLLVFVLGKIGK